MTTVAQVLQAKENTVWSISPEATVYEALKLMAEQDVGALLVLQGRELVGIISERDYARKVVLKGRISKDTRVKEIMTKEISSICPEAVIEDCMALMTARRVRHLPVFASDQLVGIISIGDVVKALLSDREFLIEQLQSYITGY